MNIQTVRNKLLLTFLSLLSSLASTVAHAAPHAVSADPTALGAWLFESHCVRCHGPYHKDRIGGYYNSAEKLQKAIERGGCRISWSRRYGGKLGGRDIRAISTFMQKWEALDGPPHLPELPPSKTPDPPEIPEPESEKKSAAAAESDAPLISSELKDLMEHNQVAQGAWLYTRNCYRCHLTYEKARMGQGIQMETVKRTVVNGKTSTQMKPFSRMKGGNLGNGEISAVIAYIAAWEKLGEPLALSPGLTTPPKADPTELLPVGLPRFSIVNGNSANGKILFARYCSNCHGNFGEGYLGPKLSGYSGVIRPDLRIKSIVKSGIPGSFMPAWSNSKNDANLSAPQIDDVTMLIVSWHVRQ